MPTPDYKVATECLQENLRILSDGFGNVPPDNQALWNVSNALLAVCDALQAIQSQLRNIEHQRH